MKKLDGGTLHEKLRLDLYFFYREQEKSHGNNRICDMSTRGFLIEILLQIYHAVDRSNLCLFIYFYYSQIMRTFTRSFY